VISCFLDVSSNYPAVTDADNTDKEMTELVRSHYRQVSVYLKSAFWGLSHEEAEDVTQTTFVNFLKNRNKYDNKRAIGPWLFTIARHCAADLLRAKRRNRTQPISDVSDVSIDLPLVELITEEELVELRDAVANLPAVLKSFVKAKYFRNPQPTDEQLAFEFRVSLRTILRWKCKSIARLKNSISSRQFKCHSEVTER
jgi:RNA polymerase sigma factor (sigma-70 family)